MTGLICIKCDVELEEFGSQKRGRQVKCPKCGLFSAIENVLDKIKDEKIKEDKNYD